MRRHNLAGELSCPDNQTACRLSGGPIKEIGVLEKEAPYQGSKSEIDALKVGAAVEEIDIIDIEEFVAQTSKQDIVTVYENLLKGSRNHLRSFVSVMEKRGVTYKAQYLTDEQFNDIIAASVERGGG